MSGSRESGFDVWDVNTAASLLAINNHKASAAHNATAITTTTQGKQQIITADIKKPYIHISTFSLASHSSSTTSSSSSLPAHFSALSLSPSSHFLLAASSSSPSLHLFSLSTTPPTLTATFSSHYRPVSCLGWSADERFLVSGGEDGCVNVHALADVLRDEHSEEERQLRHLLPTHATHSTTAGSSSSSKPYVSFSSHSLAVTALSIPALSYQSLVFSASLDHSVHVHSLVSRQTVQRFVLPCAPTAVVALQTGTAVLAGGSDGNVYYQPLITSAIKDAAPSKPAASSAVASAYSTLSGHSGAITALAASAASALLASAAADGSIRLWDLHTRHCIRTLHKQARPAYTFLAFTPSTLSPATAIDWAGLRGSRTREQTSSLRVVARQRVSGGSTMGWRSSGDVETEWRSVRAEGEVSELRGALMDERRRREAVEAELEQWKTVNRAMYRRAAAKLLDEVRQRESGKDEATNQVQVQGAVKMSEGKQREEPEEDEDGVQILGETVEDADESMEDAAEDDETGGGHGHIITVE